MFVALLSLYLLPNLANETKIWLPLTFYSSSSLTALSAWLPNANRTNVNLNFVTVLFFLASCHVCLTHQQLQGHVAAPDWLQQDTSAEVNAQSTSGLVLGWENTQVEIGSEETLGSHSARVQIAGRTGQRATTVDLACRSNGPDQLWKWGGTKRSQTTSGGASGIRWRRNLLRWNPNGEKNILV
ncbi:hypothetical protein PIB30_075728 [Stylosanthes scabra]|uniref:Uncharacterized protein n=1 Tax=Stylosanthes scabra TaxID=79078 RepID=A0ABU6QQX6_9FABA|nr:hypothetical protein [Stylosanthes scabra]